MNKQMMKKAEKLCMSPGRLDDNIERFPVEWLLSNRTVNGYPSGLDMIKDAILCMDTEHGNYQTLTEDKKAMVNELLKNENVVDVVIMTLFQWFGTSVGKSDIGTLLDDIRALKYEPASIDMLLRD